MKVAPMYPTIQDFDWCSIKDVETISSEPTQSRIKAVKGRNHRITDHPFEEEELEITEKDVLLGRGKSNLHHHGNQVYQELVNVSAERYQHENCVVTKRRIQAEIIQAIENSGGKFLKPKRNSKGWLHVPYEEKRQKVAHALQYRVRIIRNLSEQELQEQDVSDTTEILTETTTVTKKQKARDPKPCKKRSSPCPEITPSSFSGEKRACLSTKHDQSVPLHPCQTSTPSLYGEIPIQYVPVQTFFALGTPMPPPPDTFSCDPFDSGHAFLPIPQFEGGCESDESCYHDEYAMLPWDHATVDE